MELGNFIKLLLKHKYTLIAIPILAIIITYFLARNQPDVYTSQGQIATGIADQTTQVLNDQVSQDSRVTQEFSNLVQMLQSEKIVDQLSYRLILHDLTSTKPYRPASKLVEDLNASARKHAIAVYTDLYNKRQSLSLFDKDQNGLYQVLASMGYDNNSILEKLSVYRLDNSDYIHVQFDAEDSELSAFAVNTLCREFIDYYTSIVKENQNKAVAFLGNLLQQKQDSLASKTRALRQYKINNRVLNLDEQATSLYSQLSEYENMRQQYLRDAISTGAAIRRIDNQFDPTERDYIESTYVPGNIQITQLGAQMSAVNDAYIESGFDPIYKARLDSLNYVYAAKLRQQSDKVIYNPSTTKQNLVTQKIQLQTQNTIAKNSIGTINSELGRLNRKFDDLVPHEAVVGSFDKAIEIAQQEYLTILEKYNQVSMEASYSIQLRQIVTAMPGLPQPSKRMLLVLIGGIGTFIFCIIVFFIIFFLDNSIKSPKELANRTKMPVLGHLNLLNNSTIDFKKIWDQNEGTSKTKLFKNLLRSIRFEIDSEMHGNKILLINSLIYHEGKTLLAISLAYSRAVINQKVLLIDGNFEHPDITETVKPQLYLEDYLKGKFTEEDLETNTLLNVWGNRGGDVTLFEIQQEGEIRRKFEALKPYFDIIIIETSALDSLNRSKEWAVISDKVVAVFESGQDITENMKTGVAYFKGLKSKFIGWVLNKVPDDGQVKDGE
ncbi:MAG: lipopolysaccharide biosynthesis protein [Sphingobacteriaceae bacterium]|nr:MAG: lipopolysaccharide biosynthesis protein [Sphingobacteriaceae bacterium]